MTFLFFPFDINTVQIFANSNLFNLLSIIFLTVIGYSVYCCYKINEILNSILLLIAIFGFLIFSQFIPSIIGRTICLLAIFLIIFLIIVNLLSNKKYFECTSISLGVIFLIFFVAFLKTIFENSIIFLITFFMSLFLIICFYKLFLEDRWSKIGKEYEKEKIAKQSEADQSWKKYIDTQVGHTNENERIGKQAESGDDTKSLFDQYWRGKYVGHTNEKGDDIPSDDSRYIPTEVKRAVWERDGGKCVICKRKRQLHYDHDIPFSKGGSNSEKNIRILCQECNLRKSDKIE